MPSVLNDWVCDLTYMQQSVLLAMIRNADGIAKHHPQKELIKWLRRCIVRSAFDGRHLLEPTEPGGGNFTGPTPDIENALDHFIWSRDEMTFHYAMHALHAFEILGYKYPIIEHREFWHRAFLRMVHAMHQNPETENEMDMRLSDNPEKWRAREDKNGGCTSTTPPCDEPGRTREEWEEEQQKEMLDLLPKQRCSFPPINNKTFMEQYEELEREKQMENAPYTGKTVDWSDPEQAAIATASVKSFAQSIAAHLDVQSDTACASVQAEFDLADEVEAAVAPASPRAAAVRGAH